ncbi:MAG: UDP-2,3-diacylglucosamine diphosphatase [bacterium]
MDQLFSMGNKIYFASDFHFGIPDPLLSREREARFVKWLDHIGKDASEIVLLGDLFDFWFEYRAAVPKGYTRLLGKLAEITDAGIPVHLFRGNHDMWAFNYLTEELNIQLHGSPEFRQIGSKRFYLAHGDGLGPGDHGYKFLKRVFANKVNQFLFSWIHPDFGIPLALFWSRKSRYAAMAREKKDLDRTLHLIERRITTYSMAILREHPGLDFLIYGHYHYPMDKLLDSRTRQIVLGDWLTHFTYAVFDGEDVRLLTFE